MNTVITVTGPTCSGKTTLVRHLLQLGTFTEIVSTTTRPMRTGEVDGETYYFKTLDEFNKLDMIERVDFNGNAYGVSRAELESKFKSGLVPVVIVEPNGLMQINENGQKLGWVVINVFVDCPEELQYRRFLQRFADDYKRALAEGEFSGMNKILDEYASRLKMISLVEKRWLDLFMTYSKTASSIYVDSYQKGNEEETIEKIKNKVDKLSA
jgi:guanylate kinase